MTTEARVSKATFCSGAVGGKEKPIRRALNSAQRMERMIGDLLDLTRTRLGGSLPLKRRPATLQQVCQEAKMEIRATQPSSCATDSPATCHEERLRGRPKNLRVPDRSEVPRRKGQVSPDASDPPIAGEGFHQTRPVGEMRGLDK